MKDADAQAEIYTRVGREILQHRLNAGLSQAELASSIGLTRTSISNIEKGRQKMLLHTLVMIAESLRVPTASLLPASEHDGHAHAFSGSPVSDPERAQISAIVNRMKSPQQEPET